MAEHERGRRKQLVGRLPRAAGFTLIELVVVIVVLGLVAVVAIPRFGGLADAAKVNATKDEMRRLATAIAGAPDAQGRPRGGFEIDVGFPPGRLTDLAAKPDSVAAWDKFDARGWNGPYIDGSEGSFLKDAWDSTYRYDPVARTITSVGHGTAITIGF